MKHGISSKKGYEINYKRYFLASKIGYNTILTNMIGGFKTMLNKVFERVGYFFIGYKVDIKALEKKVQTLRVCNAINTEAIKNNLDKIECSFESIEALEKDIKALQGNINALTTAHNMLNQEHRELREKHNKLGLDVSKHITEVNKNSDDMNNKWRYLDCKDNLRIHKKRINELSESINDIVAVLKKQYEIKALKEELKIKANDDK